MASSTALFRVSILLIFFLAFFTIAEPRLVLDSQISTSTQGEGSSPPKSGSIDCSGACSVRCSESSRPNLCKRACGTCCLRCNCVPPGTYGNLQMCPCYAALTTHNGQPKCP